MEKPTTKTRVCLDCGVDISMRGSRAKRCESCAGEHAVQKSMERSTAWRKENPEKFRVHQKRYRKANPEKVKAIKARWRKAHPEKSAAIHREWAAANLEKVRANDARLRARISPAYAASLMHLPVAQCPPELIEMKREQLSLHRLVKVLKQEIVNQLEK